jgi:hypothetical protein
MRVLIRTDQESYPKTILHFGDEIAFPVVPHNWERRAGVEVPDDVAARWKAARDAWMRVQEEAPRLVGTREDAADSAERTC